MTFSDFVPLVCDLAEPDATFVADAGGTMFTVAQAIKIRDQQRLILPGAQSCMGWSLPAAIGAAFVNHSRVYAFTGDGSVMMNLQELETLRHLHLPVKLFIVNNGGYGCIKDTQTRLCGGRLIGVGTGCGLSFPEFSKVAAAFDLPFYRLLLQEPIVGLESALLESGPCVIEVVT